MSWGPELPPEHVVQEQSGMLSYPNMASTMFGTCACRFVMKSFMWLVRRDLQAFVLMNDKTGKLYIVRRCEKKSHDDWQFLHIFPLGIMVLAQSPPSGVPCVAPWRLWHTSTFAMTDKTDEVQAAQAAQAMKMVKDLFNKYDENGDHKLSEEELKHILGQLNGGLSSEECDELFCKLDRDHDGNLSVSEFLDYVFDDDSAAGVAIETVDRIKEFAESEQVQQVGNTVYNAYNSELGQELAERACEYVGVDKEKVEYIAGKLGSLASQASDWWSWHVNSEKFRSISLKVNWPAQSMRYTIVQYVGCYCFFNLWNHSQTTSHESAKSAVVGRWPEQRLAAVVDRCSRKRAIKSHHIRHLPPSHKWIYRWGTNHHDVLHFLDTFGKDCMETFDKLPLEVRDLPKPVTKRL